MTSQAFSMLIRYGTVGIANTLVGFAVMGVLVVLGAHYTVYTAGGYIVAFVFSYVVNGRWTFRSRNLSYNQFFVFVGVNGTLLLVVEALQIFLIEVAGYSEVFGVAAGIVFYASAGFLLNRAVVYRAVER